VIREQLQYHGALALRQDSQQRADLRVRFRDDNQVISVGDRACAADFDFVDPADDERHNKNDRNYGEREQRKPISSLL